MFAIITGGAGFIGSHLVDQLLTSRKYSRIFVFDKMTYAGNLNNLDFENPKLEFNKIDISNYKKLHKFMGRFRDTEFDVFHLAAESHVDRSIKSGLPFVNSNLLGTQIILECSLIYGARRFLHVSTDEVYGPILVGTATENSLAQPSSPYSASKAGSDLLVLASFNTHKLNIVIIRSANNYGTRQAPEKFIPRMILLSILNKSLPIYGDGSQVREWLSVHDNVAAIIQVMENGVAGEIYNVGSGIRLTNLQIVERILECTGSSSKIKNVSDRKGHDYRYALDSTKINSQIGWKSKSNILEDIPKLVDFYTNEMKKSYFHDLFKETEKSYE